jgi:hypothetical protein
MIYAIVFTCLIGMCAETPEMQKYNELYVYSTLDACKAVVEYIAPRFERGTTAGCVNERRILEWER